MRNELPKKLAKKFTDEEKLLYKADLIDSQLNWTGNAYRKVQEMLCDEKQAELVKLAPEIIAEREKAEKENRDCC